MQTPESLVSLIDEGIVDEVLRPLMSGKEAQVFLVRSQGELRVAKVYKEATHRSFRQRAEYAEGRNVRNSRDQRAIGKRTRHGREQEESAWRTAEVSTIYRLQAAGVRVPVPYHFVDGVLIMELVSDAEGNPAPRLGEVLLDRARAQVVFDTLIGGVIGMLSAGIVHGDLSDFNVLMAADGPVIIDFPQSVDASSNRNARTLLLRDVDNLHRFLSKYVPGRKPPPFAQEMWQLYERSELTPETKLTGRYRPDNALALTDDVLALIAEAERDEKKKREALGIRGPLRGGTSQQAGAGGGRGAPQQQPGRGGAPQQQPGRGGAPQQQPGRGGAQQQPGRGGSGPQQQGRGFAPQQQGRGFAPQQQGRGYPPPQQEPNGRGAAPPQPHGRGPALPSSHRGGGAPRGMPPQQQRPQGPTVVTKSQRPGARPEGAPPYAAADRAEFPPRRDDFPQDRSSRPRFGGPPAASNSSRSDAPSDESPRGDRRRRR